MATPTEPIAGALFRALRTTADPELVLSFISSRSFVGRQSLDRSLAVAAQKALRTNHFRAGWTIGTMLRERVF